MNYPKKIQVVNREIRRVALGEYLNDFQIGKNIAKFLGLSGTGLYEDGDGTEKMGKERLGSKYIFDNLGVTLILITFAILIIAFIVILLLLCSKVCSLSPKTKERIEKLKNKIFYNPLIRYSLLNTMNLNMTAMTAFVIAPDDVGEVTVALAILLTINILPICYARLLHQKKAELGTEDSRIRFGTLFGGLDLDDASSKIVARHNHKIHRYPLLFMYRRTIFIAITIALFSFPSLQFLAHQVTSTAYMMYVMSRQHMFESAQQKYFEVAAELIHFLLVTILQQSCRSSEQSSV